MTSTISEIINKNPNCNKNNCIFKENTEVEKIITDKNQVIGVKTRNETIKTKEIIVCSGAWTNKIKNIDGIIFEGHFLFRKSGRVLTPTGVYLSCEIFEDGLKGLSPRITNKKNRYIKRLKKNKNNNGKTWFGWA